MARSQAVTDLRQTRGASMSATTTGRYEVTTLRVRLRVQEPGGDPTETVRGPVDVVRIARAIYADLDADQEHFTVLALNTANQVDGYKVVASGAMDAAHVDPRLIFRAALYLGAAAIVLVHNHPSGSPEPSGDDLRITAKLDDAGKVVGMNVLDHVILGAGRFVSLRERGAFK